MRRRLEAAQYSEVKTPQLVDRSLWEASGHWGGETRVVAAVLAASGSSRHRSSLSCSSHPVATTATACVALDLAVTVVS